MSSKTFTITARQFRDLVSPVLPFVDKSSLSVPALAGIRLRTSGPYLVATATDRYVLAIKRTGAVENPPKSLQANVSASSIRSILAIFKPSRQADPDLEFTFTDATLTVRAAGFDLAGTEGVMGELTYPLTVGQFPPIHKLIRDALEREQVAAPVGLNPNQLGNFRYAQTEGEPIVLRSSGEGRPVIVRVGEDFIGLVQPVRFVGNASSDDPTWTDILAADDKVETTKGKAA